MIEKLRQFHADTLAAAKAIDDMVRSGRPDIAALGAARLKLMAVSRERLAFLEGEVYPLLLATGNNRDVADLREDARLRMTEAAGHIARWNSSEITAHWDEYLRAADQIRHKVRHRVRCEVAVLYPLLEALRAQIQARAA